MFKMFMTYMKLLPKMKTKNSRNFKQELSADVPESTTPLAYENNKKTQRADWWHYLHFAELATAQTFAELAIAQSFAGLHLFAAVNKT